MHASYYWPSCRCLVSRWMRRHETMPCQISPVLWRPPALLCLQTDVNVRAEAQTARSLQTLRQDVPAASLFHRSDHSSVTDGEMLTPYDVTGKTGHACKRSEHAAPDTHTHSSRWTHPSLHHCLLLARLDMCPSQLTLPPAGRSNNV